MVYNPHAVDRFLRRFTPGYGRLGIPKHVGDKSSLKHLQEHKYEIAKTKAEVVDEYYHVMHFVYERTTKALIAGMVAVYFYFQLFLGGGGSFNLFVAMLATAYSMYYWWHAGAAYSNWQEFEMRPVLMPIENIAVEQAGGAGSGH